MIQHEPLISINFRCNFHLMWTADRGKLKLRIGNVLAFDGNIAIQDMVILTDIYTLTITNLIL